MYNFDENKVRQEHQNGVDIIPKVESIVDQVCNCLLYTSRCV